MKNITTIKVLFIFLVSLFIYQDSIAQCNNFVRNYPQTIFSNPSAANYQYIATDMSAGDYVYFDVVQGDIYEWTTCGDQSFDTYLNLYDEQGNVLIYHNDDYCGLQSKIIWRATFTGRVRMLLSSYACQTNNYANMTLKWKEYTGVGSRPITGVIPDPRQLLICGSISDTVIAQALGTCTGNFEFRFLDGATVVQNWSTLDYIILSPPTSRTYTVEARCSSTPTTVSSDTFRVDVIAEPTITGIDSICEGDSTFFTASGSTGDFEWWTDSVGGTQLDTTAVFFTPAMNASNTFWVQANGMGAGGGASVLIAECATETPTNSDDYIEIANLYSVPVNMTGWIVAISSDYNNINNASSTYWHLPNTMGPCQVDYRQDNSSYANYWGSNMMWNPGSAAYGSFNSWAIIIDNLGNVVDFCTWGWTAAEIALFNPTINGHNITLGAQWVGNGCSSLCGAGAVTNSHQRTGNADSNTLNDFTCQSCTQNVLNPGLSCGWVSVSCRFPVDLTVLPNPIITATASPDSICRGSNSTLAANSSTGATTTYLWDNGLGTGQSHNVSPSVTTTFTVTGTDQGCSGSTDVMLTVIDAPAFSTSSIDDHCGQGIGSASVNTNPFNSILWNTTPPSTADSIGNLTAGNYTVKVTNALCSDSAIVTVNDIPGPTASFAVNPSHVELGQDVYCTDFSIGATAWDWDFGANATPAASIVQHPMTKYSAEGQFTIHLTVTDDYGCADSTSQTVKVEAPYTFYVPNAFSPNNDGINDVFIPKGIFVDEERYEFVIYNRWGELVFETKDVNVGWDGNVNSNTIKSTENVTDVFVYVIKLYDINGDYHEYIGEVSLIR